MKCVFSRSIFLFSESSRGWGSTSNAFIFSLRNKEGLGPFKSMVTQPRKAIYRNSDHGPAFGEGYDIIIDTILTAEKFGHSYSVPIGVQDRYTILAGSYLTPDDWEVFYLG